MWPPRGSNAGHWPIEDGLERLCNAFPAAQAENRRSAMNAAKLQFVKAFNTVDRQPVDACRFIAASGLDQPTVGAVYRCAMALPMRVRVSSAPTSESDSTAATFAASWPDERVVDTRRAV
jgi:hypothetical protein